MMKIKELFAAASAVFESGASTEDISAVEKFELARYMGKWHEIERITHWFERGMERVTAEYTLDAKGRVQVVNSGWRNGVRHSAHGFARMKKHADGSGELEVSFFRPFYSAYRVIILEDDYSAAAVTGASRDYLWILARNPDFDAAEYRKRLAAAGFDVSKLHRP